MGFVVCELGKGFCEFFSRPLIPNVRKTAFNFFIFSLRFKWRRWERVKMLFTWNKRDYREIVETCKVYMQKWSV